MKNYQIPLINRLELDSFHAELQSMAYLQPDCSSGIKCEDGLGFERIEVGEDQDPPGAGPCALPVSFFLSGRTDPSDPIGCVIKIEGGAFGSQTGSSCVYELDSHEQVTCPGQVWEVVCSFTVPDGSCVPESNFGTVSVDCGHFNDQCGESTE